MGVAATNELLRVWSLQCWLCSVCYLCEAPVGFFFILVGHLLSFYLQLQILKSVFVLLFFFFSSFGALEKHICLSGSLPQPLAAAAREHLCAGLHRTVQLLANLYLLPHSAVQCVTGPGTSCTSQRCECIKFCCFSCHL